MKRSQAVLITGATYGIGRAILEKFSLEGRRVVAVARSRDKLKELVKDIRSRGGEADYLCADLSDPVVVKRSMKNLINKFAPIDTVILNAGYSNNLAFEDTTDKLRRQEFDLNYFSPALIIETLLPHLLNQKNPHIISIGSLTGFIPFPGNSNYASSKAALYGLMRNLMIELKDESIHLGTVIPGLVMTQLSEGMGGLIPALTPEEVAEATYDCYQSDSFFIVPGITNQLTYLFDRFFPQFFSDLVKILGPSLIPSFPLRKKQKSKAKTKSKSRTTGKSKSKAGTKLRVKRA